MTILDHATVVKQLLIAFLSITSDSLNVMIE